MKKIAKCLFVLVVLNLTLISCTNYGKEQTYNGVQLFHTTSVSDSEADKLGNYLIQSEFADGEYKTVQLNKTGGTYEFRMVVKKGVEQDQEYCNIAKAYAAEMSSTIFNGSQVDIHFCDESLNTLRVIPMNIN